MKDRIKQIMESQHMTQQVFAQYIAMSPATLSSIFNGRTKPTMNIVEAIKKKIPDISTDWLMFGTGTMYLDQNAQAAVENAVTATPKEKTPDPTLDFASFDSPAPSRASAPHYFNGVKNTRPETPREEIKIIDKPQRKVIEIRVFYDDQTWDTFVPAKK